MDGKPVLQNSAEVYRPSGHLDPLGFKRHIDFQTYPPPPDLAPFLAHFWSLSWDRGDQDPYISEQVMHRPFVDVFLSKPESGIQCTFLGKRDYLAAGTGRIIGARFLPGAFHAFWPGRMAGLHDSNLPLESVFPEADILAVETILAQDNPTAIHRLLSLIEAHKPTVDPFIEFINQIIAAVEADPELRTVAAVAKRFARSERWLQQFFSDYLGIGLKWFLQRARLLGAAKRIQQEDKTDWAGLAYDLGYSSQQHFISDFKRAIGKTPLQYKKALSTFSW